MGHSFLAMDGSDASLAVLVIKGRDSRAILARPVLRRGRLRGGAVGQVAASIRRLGHHQRVLLKKGNDPAL
eukprot:11868381-Alexandrium_andersonii.AAC.1